MLTNANEWVTHTQPNGKTYYYHLLTQKSTWKRPPCLDQENVNFEVLAELKSKDKQLWLRERTKTGRFYFYNPDTFETRWEVIPSSTSIEEHETKEEHTEQKVNDEESDEDKEMDREEETDSSVSDNNSDQEDQNPPLPPQDAYMDVRRIPVEEMQFSDSESEEQLPPTPPPKSTPESRHDAFFDLLAEQNVFTRSDFEQQLTQIQLDPRYQEMSKVDGFSAVKSTLKEWLSLITERMGTSETKKDHSEKKDTFNTSDQRKKHHSEWLDGVLKKYKSTGAVTFTQQVFSRFNPETKQLTNIIRSSSFSRPTANSTISIICIASAHFIFFYYPDTNKLLYIAVTIDSVRLSCVAIHPTVGMVAAGNSAGVIRTWELKHALKISLAGGDCICDWHLSQKGTFPPITSIHWHSSAVRDMCYSPVGGLLLSVGSEGTIVMWRTQDMDNSFIPRLGGLLTGVSFSPNGQMIAVTRSGTKEGSVPGFLILDLNSLSKIFSHDALGMNRNGKHFGNHPLFGQERATGTESGLFVWRSSPDTVQIVKEDTFSLLATYSYSSSAIVSSTNTLVSVQHAFLTNDTNWLVVMTSRPIDNAANLSIDKKLADEIVMHVWVRNDENVYVPHTIVNSPHSKTVLHAVPHPSLPAFVTCGVDKEVKIWEFAKETLASPQFHTHLPLSSQNTDATAPMWTCSSVLTYRNATPHCAAFSTVDRTTRLFVGFGNAVVVYDYSQRTILTTLLPSPFSPLSPHFTVLSHSTTKPLLAGINSDGLSLWNTETNDLEWCVKGHFRSAVFCESRHPDNAQSESVIAAVMTIETSTPMFRHNATNFILPDKYSHLLQPQSYLFFFSTTHSASSDRSDHVLASIGLNHDALDISTAHSNPNESLGELLVATQKGEIVRLSVSTLLSSQTPLQ
ncbi:putative NET1-associated nuclear protein 1 (U3 small nucleolar RNA-associated protein 17) [Blattamonas nauphoetae]|uniref:NET1-associated nuclear protein 1 (U3 small nucleolar RNA-associated protein 17) n=1 Tax=Blattamonas nauphoetae TaxID=2049346 RepID=A0ABQ9YKV1_9EUKA|nr:putative NET1-associated nuclear protein 1 (U3 small nucleolar RNA-associated protein 17) [Blattamonas nauphoetae]